MDGLIIVAFAAGAGAAAWAGAGALRGVLRARAILDHPNERSSHAAPVPRGAGIAVVGAALVAWALAMALGFAAVIDAPVLVGALVLALVSWVDDVRGLGAPPRLAAQLAVVAFVMVAAPPGLAFQGWLPAPLDHVIVAIAWLWFVNLFNFMDGIDGIAGAETACVAGGVAVILAILGFAGAPLLPALLLVAVAVGFLPWNWHPARIFLGDVGSVPLGFMLGWLLLDLAGRGAWAAALILPAYYLADASWTLARRALRGEAIWRAHREHFYQRATQGGLSHAAAARAVLVCNAALVACAVLSLAGTGATIAALCAAAVSVAALLWYFQNAAHRPPRPGGQS
jgi:UDP-N-acetylmuramyl pentapeptide phosphotransferase/UDP-N-acetylglucosamine-1-phosphate transferase